MGVRNEAAAGWAGDGVSFGLSIAGGLFSRLTERLVIRGFSAVRVASVRVLDLVVGLLVDGAEPDASFSTGHRGTPTVPRHSGLA